MRSPILLLVFNRPDTTRRVFASIRSAKPSRLYIAADGPRLDKEGEVQRCQAVREIVSQVDWPCHVSTLFRETNLGCKLAVSNAISWFFEQEEEGIIIEDDILALPSFFRYCDELLAYYRDDPQVAMISGNNFVASYVAVKDSYTFSKYCHIWGWATWRRAWQYYDVAIPDWPFWKNHQGLGKLADHNIFFQRYWRSLLDQVYQGKIDTWDYQWNYTCWKMGLLSILPKTNLVVNIGFGKYATHTIGAIPKIIAQATPKDLSFPLQHPANQFRNKEMDKLIDKLVFNLTLRSKLQQKLLNYWSKFPLLHKVAK